MEQIKAKHTFGSKDNLKTPIQFRREGQSQYQESWFFIKYRRF